METPERIWFLISRNLSGDATDQDTKELMDLLQQQPGLMQQYDMLHQLWLANRPLQEEPVESDTINRILKLSADEKKGSPQVKARLFPLRRWRTLYWAAAAIIAFSLLFWGAGEWMKKRAELAANEIVAPRGSKIRTLLPDGSTVWLNAGSRIVYANFNGPLREVTLEGEAFFDIVHATSLSTGKKVPFIVHAGNVDIKVLGTAFNVKSYPDDKTIETTLIRGLVQITQKGGTKQQPLYLHPNEKIVLPKEVPETNSEPPVKNAPAKANDPGRADITHLDSTLKENERFETAWIFNRLEFRGDNFEQLAPKLERWYNVQIHFEDDAVRRLQFNGSLANETVEQAFDALKTAALFNVTIRNNDIYIKSAK